MGVVDEIKSRLDIVEFISAYAPSLKKAGRTYKGLCPFHAEKTPSFIVFPETQTWHCFGACGAGGDIFGFLMRREGYDFAEALKVLADKAGVLLHERSAEALETDKIRRRLLEIMSAAATFFYEQLTAVPEGAFAREYIAGRGLSQATIHRFQLGYAPNQWDALKLHLLKKGYAEPDLVSAGLLVVKEDGSAGYDRFRDRFMVPIRDVQGDVIGFGARALHEGQVPKYLNSPQSALFDKSATLFALDVAKNAIREGGQAVIVEGYMDALQAHERGFTNVVAEMGTALTEAQLHLLKRFTSRFVLALDADTAGSAATLRGINVARESLSQENVPVPTAGGLIRYENRLDADIRIAALPPGKKDPDDVLKEGPQAWQAVIDQAAPLVDYYIKAVTAGLDLTTAKGKTAAVQAIMPILQELKNPVEQNNYLLELARLVKIEERTLRAELQRAPAKTNRPVVAKPPAIAPEETAAGKTAPACGLEEICLAMLIGQPAVLDRVNQKLYNNKVEILAVEDFANVENGALFLIIKKWAVSQPATLDALIEQVSHHLEGRLALLIDQWHSQTRRQADSTRPPTIEEVEKQLPQIILRLRRQQQEARIEKLSFLLADATSAGDQEAELNYKRMVSEVKTAINKLDKAKDALSIMGRRRIEEKYSG